MQYVVNFTSMQYVTPSLRASCRL